MARRKRNKSSDGDPSPAPRTKRVRRRPSDPPPNYVVEYAHNTLDEAGRSFILTYIHKSESHNGKRFFDCSHPLCTKVTARDNHGIRAHLGKHASEVPCLGNAFKCQLGCDLSFNYPKHRNEHYKDVHPGQDRREEPDMSMHHLLLYLADKKVKDPSFFPDEQAADVSEADSFLTDDENAYASDHELLLSIDHRRDDLASSSGYTANDASNNLFIPDASPPPPPPRLPYT